MTQIRRASLLSLMAPLAFSASLVAAETPANPGDWPQWGGSSARNNASPAKDLPLAWKVGEFDKKTGQWLGKGAERVRWVAKLGSESYGSPVVAGDRVFCATNNAGYSSRYPAAVDLGCLVCFRRDDGKFLWQHSVEKLPNGQKVDWPRQGICSSPVVEGDRLWIVTNRGEVACLDAEGFADGENDGPFQAEKSTELGESDVVWLFDMMREVGSVQRYMASCSPTTIGDLLLVGTSNGVDPNDELPAPEAPSFLALDKQTGKLAWADASPGRNLLDGQWSSPAAAELGGVAQAIFAGGDGWVYGFEAVRTPDRKARMLWRFDANPKDSVWEGGGQGRRNNIIATPAIHEGRVYVATGQDPEAGEGEGDLWCIDPTKRGDASAELVVDAQGKLAPPRRLRAVEQRERVVPNPNSAAVWNYRGKPGSKDFKEIMHRSIGTPVVHDGLVVIGDFSGLVHCLEANSGKALWTHDMLSAIWGTALVADGKIYLGNEDGDVVVFRFGREKEVLATNPMNNAIYGGAAAAGGTLYVNTRSHLFAIR